ncbi:monovalent cation/H(+) antiporter subunit G [Desulfosarcina variabilis]|uniref:monovalent cation/H(+) antiporter subunit G n=1 Tax=Desulfosarcina variabilis TaxID=2300 RepID=UPI003AFB478A
MNALIAATLLLVGTLFCLVAAVGMLRLPDTLIRMHAATKAGTLGAGFILAAQAVATGELGTTLKVIAVIVFLLLTAPVAAHLIGRAAYHRGIQLYKGTWIDELDMAMKKDCGQTGSQGTTHNAPPEN